ncbi:MAG: BMP family ABC transporter substrate-binding protein [Desulfobacterales bacterium]|nr:BMP family ABC transporter substrate-binding protein [Desulfobacterales bacterium]
MKRIFVVFTTMVFLVGHTSFAQTFTVGFAMGAGGLGDQSFNDITYTGLARAQKKHGIRLVLDVPKEEEAGYEATLQRLIDKKVDIIVANGWEYEEPVKKYATQYPKQRFLMNDVPIEGLPNVISSIYEQHEGSFLVGVLAGLMTKTNTVGFIGGVDIAVIHAYRIGYHEGVLYANPKAKILDAFISVGKDFSGFSNPGRGKKLALEHYQRGADVIFAAAGLSSNGVIYAAQQQKKFAIGVDSDQDHLAKGYVLTSMMNRLDQSTFQEISKIVAGDFTPGIKTYGLKKGGVSLSPMKFTKDIIPDNVHQQIKDAKDKILTGKITVTNYFEQSQ